MASVRFPSAAMALWLCVMCACLGCGNAASSRKDDLVSDGANSELTANNKGGEVASEKKPAGIKFVLSLPYGAAEDGVPFAANVVLENNGDKPVFIFPEMPQHRELWLTVHAESGELVKRSDYGDFIMRPESFYDASVGIDSIFVDEQRRWEKDVVKSFRLTPGEYTIQASLVINLFDGDEPQGYTLRSNSVKFVFRRK